MTTAISRQTTTPNQIANTMTDQFWADVPDEQITHHSEPAITVEIAAQPRVPAGILNRAHKLATTKTTSYGPDNFWVGMSGEQVTGEQVAHHLEAALALLTRNGWTRRYQDDEPDVDLSGDINTMNPVTILRKLFALVRWEYFSTDKRYTLPDALWQVVSKGTGDHDTHYVAGHVLSTIIRASRGETENVHWLIQDAWSKKLGRTQDEVMTLLAAGAAFARQYGPAPTRTALFA